MLWKDGCPPGLAVSYVDAAHGDLLRHAGAFADYLALLRTGRSSLPSVPQGARDSTSVLRFVAAPMVHWPEVMMTYDETDKLLLSADAFGCFGALNGACGFQNPTARKNGVPERANAASFSTAARAMRPSRYASSATSRHSHLGSSAELGGISPSVRGVSLP